MLLVLGDQCLCWYIYFVPLLLSSVNFLNFCLNKVYFFVWEYFTLYSTVPVEEKLILFSEADWRKILIMVMNVGVCVHVWMKVFVEYVLGNLEVFVLNFCC